MTIGALVQVLFALNNNKRDLDQKTGITLYQVFQLSMNTGIVEIQKIDTSILHFVSNSAGTWWFNPYVPCMTTCDSISAKTYIRLFVIFDVL